MNKIIQGCALTELPKLPAESVNCCVTSPPYWGLRDYGVPPKKWPDSWVGCLGLEPTPEMYVSHIVMIFQEVKRVLKNDGTLWLNIGDSYAGGGRAGNNPEYVGKHKMFGKTGWNPGVFGLPQKVPEGLKPKDKVGIPWMVAFALRADGWYLRQDIIWNKNNPMPESCTDRPTTAHEYIFLLSKSKKYYYDKEAIAEPATSGIGKLQSYHNPNNEKYNSVPDERWKHQFNGRIWGKEETRNKRSVWTVNSKPFKDAHFATFPPDLIDPCIRAGCPADGIVLDPFIGAGTTALVSLKLNRQYLGIEINPEYIQIANSRLQEKMGLFL